MNLARLPFCALGVHQRDSRRTKHDGESWQSECVGCRVRLTRIDGRWRQPLAVKDGRNRTLDAIRGLAICLVITWHFATPLVFKYFPPVGPFLSTTWSGVDLFFVLSGFLIGGILIRKRGAEKYFRVFYGRRAIRIIPLYIVTLVLFFAIWPEPFSVVYLVFGQNIVWALHDTFGPGPLAITWSLAIEEQFYLILPLLVTLCPPRRLPWVVAALALAAPLVRIAFHAAGLPHAAYLMLPARMDSLLLGVLAAWAQIEDRFPSRRALTVSATLTGLAFAGLTVANLPQLGPVMGTIGYSVIALFYASCLALVVSRKTVLPAWASPLAYAGLGAYSLYLFHTMIFDGVTAVRGAGIVTHLTSLILCGVVAALCWLLVEKPAIDWGHRRLRYRNATDGPSDQR